MKRKQASDTAKVLVPALVQHVLYLRVVKTVPNKKDRTSGSLELVCTWPGVDIDPIRKMNPIYTLLREIILKKAAKRKSRHEWIVYFGVSDAPKPDVKIRLNAITGKAAAAALFRAIATDFNRQELLAFNRWDIDACEVM